MNIYSTSIVTRSDADDTDLHSGVRSVLQIK